MNNIAQRAELIFTGLLTIAITLQVFNNAVPILYLISLGGLAMVFFLFAFSIKHKQGTNAEGDNSIKELLGLVIIPRILWIATAISCVGILFNLLEFPGDYKLLIVGGGAIATCTLILLVLRFLNLPNFYRLIPILYRSYPALLVAAYLIYKA